MNLTSAISQGNLMRYFLYAEANTTMSLSSEVQWLDQSQASIHKPCHRSIYFGYGIRKQGQPPLADPVSSSFQSLETSETYPCLVLLVLRRIVISCVPKATLHIP